MEALFDLLLLLLTIIYILNNLEGYGRRYTGEYVRFLNIAQGSINELETHLILSAKVKLCTQNDITNIINLLKEESRMIIALLKKLEK